MIFVIKVWRVPIKVDTNKNWIFSFNLALCANICRLWGVFYTLYFLLTILASFLLHKSVFLLIIHGLKLFYLIKFGLIQWLLKKFIRGFNSWFDWCGWWLRSDDGGSGIDLFYFLTFWLRVSRLKLLFNNFGDFTIVVIL